MNPNFFAERTPPAGGVSIEEGEEKVIATVQTVKTTPVNEDVPMTDQKSNTSFDPLFDDDAEGSDVPKPGEHTLAGTPSINDLALPSPVKPKPDIEPKQPGTDKPLSPVTGMNASKSGPSLAGPSSGGGRIAAASIPLLGPKAFRSFSDDIILTSSMDGQVTLIDRRVPSHRGAGGVGRLLASERAPPWCMSVSLSSLHYTLAPLIV
jgi:transcriptional activator SPT8